ncbi:MAG: hypothetical protein AB1558_10225 [Thermodesulfobacteriota bacterium]
MNRTGLGKYRRTDCAFPSRPLVAASIEGIEQAVVIPALAERDSLFRTLACLARNPEGDLRRTMVICVVNNHRPSIAGDADILVNREALALLHALVFRLPGAPGLPEGVERDIRLTSASALRLAYIDASSGGVEIPDRDGGVGTARKIGMDAALQVIGANEANGGVIGCLDADTLVEENYLSAIWNHLNSGAHPASVTGYAHQKPGDPALLAAICCYEIFLRAYVIGLAHAGSPYAFHSIGSTMCCTSAAYAAVRGMNRRPAAEDFHFLNKLAKIGPIGVLSATTVFPSPRPSKRVPFGTGQRMNRFLAGGTDEYRLYDPRIFEILKRWLALMATGADRDPDSILRDAGSIHGELAAYLRMCRFVETWRLIRQNSRDPGQLRRQFQTWFDGLKTLRLVHHLSRSTFSPVPMFDAVNGHVPLAGRPFGLAGACGGVPDPDEQYRMLTALRAAYPFS